MKRERRKMWKDRVKNKEKEGRERREKKKKGRPLSPLTS